MEQYEYTKYISTKESLRDTLDNNGVAIIPNVLNSNECSDILDGIWSFFEHITKNWNSTMGNIKPIDRNNKDTWGMFYKLYPLHSMLIQYWNVGHAQVSWDIRQNTKIVDIFSYFYKCTNEELLVSFDGLSFNMPPEVTKRGWNKDNTWFHTDQSYTRNNFECLQSWVTGLDVNDGDATLAIMEGSHKYHGEFAKKFNCTDKADWYKLTKEQEKFYSDLGCVYKKIKCPKGSLVLWDSRTIHCGVEALKERLQPNIRSIIYLCYMPRNQCNSETLIKRQKALTELRSTTHNPIKHKLFPKNPRTYGCEIYDITTIEPPILTDLGKKLSGF